MGVGVGVKVSRTRLAKAAWEYVVKNWLPSFAFGVSRLAEGIVWPFRYVDSEETLPVENAKFDGNVLDIADIVSTVGDLRAVVTEWKDQSRPKRQVYGLLYNWWVAAGIVTPGGTVKEKEIAPEGYRVATNGDWMALEAYVIANPPADSTTVGNYLKSKRQVNSLRHDGMPITHTGALGT
jgi:hypothetical protein